MIHNNENFDETLFACILRTKSFPRLYRFINGKENVWIIRVIRYANDTATIITYFGLKDDNPITSLPDSYENVKSYDNAITMSLARWKTKYKYHTL